MTRRTTTATLAALICGLAMSNAQAGLLGHWKLDGNTSNSGSTGATNNGTLAGGTNYVAGPSGFGQALNFDGTTGYMVVDNSSTGPLALVGTSYTISIWAKADGSGNSRFNRMFTADDGADFSGGYGAFGAPVDALYTHAWGGGTNTSASSVLPAQDNEWHHFAFRYDSGATSLDIFVDGTKTNLQPAGLPPLTSDGNDPLRIGAGAFDIFSTFNFQGFDGALDDFRIYDEALSDNAVLALMIPEPASLLLMGMGALAMIRRTRR